MRNAYRRSGSAGGGDVPVARGLRGTGPAGRCAGAWSPSSSTPSRSRCRPRPRPPFSPPRPASPPRADIALVVDTSTPAHAAVADEIVAALPPRRYRVERFTTADARRARRAAHPRVTVVAVGPEAVAGRARGTARPAARLLPGPGVRRRAASGRADLGRADAAAARRCSSRAGKPSIPRCARSR